MLLVTLLTAFSVPGTRQSHAPLEASVYFSNGEYTLSVGKLDTSAAAWGSFADTLNVTGWGVLDIRTGAEYTDVVQHHAAGVLEGALTAMAEQDAWTRAQIKMADPSDTFWAHVAAVTAQFDGMVEGYSMVAAKGTVPHLPVFAFQLLNGIGDLFQIIPSIDESARPDWTKMTTKEKRLELQRKGHCSAIIKVTGAFEDLYQSHSSWFEYPDMNRIFKHYHFAFKAKTGANRISFSSYPGYLESLDDFYMMDSGLGMVQTSNGVMNHSLYDLITTSSLLAWQRVRVASAMASTGKEWWEAFKTHASGTYVNQYMVTDFKLFTPGKALQPGTLWVVEEIPGLVAGGDQTATLARGDPYAINPSDGSVDYGAAICMRGDLGHGGAGSAGGCYDTKVTSYNHGFWNLSAEAVNGSSTNPPFAWRPTVDNKTSHAGLPNVFNFPFVRITARE
eukprot:gene11971-23531_t